MCFLQTQCKNCAKNHTLREQEDIIILPWVQCIPPHCKYFHCQNYNFLQCPNFQCTTVENFYVQLLPKVKQSITFYSKIMEELLYSKVKHNRATGTSETYIDNVPDISKRNNWEFGVLNLLFRTPNHKIADFVILQLRLLISLKPSPSSH